MAAAAVEGLEVAAEVGEAVEVVDVRGEEVVAAVACQQDLPHRATE